MRFIHLHCNFNMLNLPSAGPRRGTRMKHFFYWSIERKGKKMKWLAVALCAVSLLHSSPTECPVFCESESTLNHACLIILSYTAVYNRDTYVHVSSASVSNVGLSFIMFNINQHLLLEIAITKFFNNGYGKYQNLHSANSVNAAEK